MGIDFGTSDTTMINDVKHGKLSFSLDDNIHDGICRNITRDCRRMCSTKDCDYRWLGQLKICSQRQSMFHLWRSAAKAHDVGLCTSTEYVGIWIIKTRVKIYFDFRKQILNHGNKIANSKGLPGMTFEPNIRLNE
jgi:hypothetical protein